MKEPIKQATNRTFMNGKEAWIWGQIWLIKGKTKMDRTRSGLSTPTMIVILPLVVFANIFSSLNHPNNNQVYSDDDRDIAVSGLCGSGDAGWTKSGNKPAINKFFDEARGSSWYEAPDMIFVQSFTPVDCPKNWNLSQKNAQFATFQAQIIEFFS